MTDPTEFIRASREICDAATPGEWRQHGKIPVVSCHDKERGYQIHSMLWVKNTDAGEDIYKGMLSTYVKDAAFIAHARTALPRALDIIEAQQKQIGDLRDELADEQAVSADWQRYYMALSDLAHGDKPACLAPEVCGEEHGPCKSCAAYKQLAEQQSRMDEALTNQRRTLAAETDEALAKLAKVQADASAKLAEQQAEITRLTDDLKHIAYNISLSVPPGYNDAESFYRAGLMSAINRAAWAVSPKDKP